MQEWLNTTPAPCSFNIHEGETTVKKLLFLTSIIAVVTTGCVSDGVRPESLAMTRTVKVADYEKTVTEMSKQIELQNKYEARDVKTQIYGDYITVTVYAERMREIDARTKSLIRLQDENLRLKKELEALKKDLKK